MVKTKIRLRYSGFIIFASQLLSFATGLAFTLMITRSVSTEEFGILGNVNDVSSYFILLASVLPFWTTRFVAREHTGSAKTGLIANIFISITSASIYLALLPIILSALQISGAYAILYTIISFQIVELYTISALEAVLRAKQPQNVGYGLLIYEVCKVILGFTLIIHLKLGLQGAIYSMTISYFTQIAFYAKMTAKELKQSVRWTYLKEWLKASPINVYAIIGNRIAVFTLIFLFMYAELARGYYQAASSIAGFIGNSAFLAFALYPKLLSETNIEDISTSLKMVLLYAIPMTTGAIILSDSYLTILNPVYTDAKLILSILAISFLSTSLSQVLHTIIAGTERLDAKAKIAFKELIKSRLFLLFTLSYIQSLVTLPTTFFVLFYVAKTPLEAATYFAIINVIANSAILLCRYAIARKCLTFNFPWKSLAKYITASAVMAALLFVIPHPTRLSQTVALTLLGAAAYLTVLALIDKEAKSLLNSIIQEAMRIIKIKKPQKNVSEDCVTVFPKD